MSHEARLFDLLTVLLQERSLARTRCSAAFIELLQPLLAAGIISEQRSGPGRSLVVQDPAALAQFSRERFPNVHLPDPLGSRASGLARFRDSKALANDTPEVVLVRAWSPDSVTNKGQPTPAVSCTAEHGTFAFLLQADSQYALHGVCALVENPLLFLRFERLEAPVGLVIYGQGRASNRLIEWLAGLTAPDFTLLHLPDYDPTGLSEFERLRARLGDRVRLHLPQDLAQRFERFSNRALLDRPNSQAMLAALRLSTSVEVQHVVGLIHRYNAGLEQEALLIANAWLSRAAISGLNFEQAQP